MHKILLLEDDIALQEIIKECLEEEGYSVVCCSNGDEAEDKAYEEHFDLFLLDVMVGGQNGFSALKNIRKNNKDTPAIFITALNTPQDLERGFKSGCDDYLRKPFELKELLLRIEARLKRVQNTKLFDFKNGYTFDIDNDMLYFDGVMQKMPTKERELLKILLKNHNKFVDTDTIFNTIWSYDEEPSGRSLRVYIKNLRIIVGKENILTRRGEGYCLSYKN
ncbi:MAG: response regulator transcription factor [Helicobacter sp.]|nr:response regulator transcription factor [Helicobacteraceae bacterium]MDY3113921.1 response regulator transcription factor [Helicobacter sp.]